MSRKENYFHPVKDLVSDEQKKCLIDHFFLHKEKYDLLVEEGRKWWDEKSYLKQVYLDLQKEYGHLNLLQFKEMVKKWDVKIKPVPFNPIEDKNAKFYYRNLYPEMFNIPEITDIENYYNGKIRNFLYTKGGGITVNKHTDRGRNCCVTIPLVPDYSKYRSCYFYDKYDQEKATYEVKYSEIRSAVLLNNSKIHSVDNKENDTPSLCVQIIFEASKKYAEIRKLLSENGLLI
ncbi:hypothetical protein OAA34_00540 [bacterium]|nr:hypothetical protein [bacterium]